MIKKLAIVLFAAAFAAALPAFAGGPLDGKSFHGKLTETGKKSGHNDTFEFKDGQFRSTGCAADGFQYGTYAFESAGSSTFTAQVTSKKEGTMDWKGTVTGDSITGTAVWTRQGKPPVNYTFTASAKK